MNIGLFFGSFNPIHVGHLILAESIVENSNVQQVWFVVSPQNPFKKKSTLAHEFDRYDMVRQAIGDNPHFDVTDVEFHMPRPSYTIDTLTYLSEKFPQHHFKLIMGEDNLKGLKKWKNYEQILEGYGVLVYPRPHAAASALSAHNSIEMIDAPMVDISATFIRNAIRKGKSIKYLVHEDVAAFIKMKKLYQ